MQNQVRELKAQLDVNCKELSHALLVGDAECAERARTACTLVGRKLQVATVIANYKQVVKQYRDWQFWERVGRSENG